MRQLTILDLETIVKSYNMEAWPNVKKAYELARRLHNGQKRESGEDYIIHPLNVAYTLAEMHADEDTLCAGLLHDTLEDTYFSKEDIEREFNSDVAEIVDGVTKVNKLEYDNKEEADAASTRKLFTSLKNDIRIIVVKLADRLHNMSTLGFKNKKKQREIAIETLEFYVPTAHNIGAYEIKSKLEDYCLQYLKPITFNDIREKQEIIKTARAGMILDMMGEISNKLDVMRIKNQIIPRYKNIYGLYRKISNGEAIESIDDLTAIKVMVENVDNCYRTFGAVHGLYTPVDEKFKDYISNPKTNRYRSIHTTVCIGDNRYVQTRIRTFDMELIDTYGICAYWYLYREKGTEIMENSLITKYPVFDLVSLLDSFYPDDKDFVNQLKIEALSDKVFVYTPDGKWMELPKGSCVIDYAYKLNPAMANQMISSKVNDKEVQLGHLLNTKDRIEIKTDPVYGGPTENWVEYAHTSLAKQLILEHLSKK